MGQDAFVDVAYRGLEVGRRLKLREVGPNTAYVEVGTPMPVGTGLVIRTDGGLDISATVIRVHEQVAGAEMPPGMRIRVGDLDEAAAGWWRDQVSRDDPQIPEAEVVPAPLPPLPPAEVTPPAEPLRDTVVMEAVDPATIDAEIAAAAQAAAAAQDAAAQDAAEPSSGNGATSADARHTASASHTTVMSAVELSHITDLASADSDGDTDEGESDSDAEADGPAADRESSGNGTPGSNGDELQGARSRGKRRRRRK